MEAGPRGTPRMPLIAGPGVPLGGGAPLPVARGGMSDKLDT